MPAITVRHLGETLTQVKEGPAVLLDEPYHRTTNRKAQKLRIFGRHFWGVGHNPHIGPAAEEPSHSA